MANFILLVTVALAGTSFISYTAQDIAAAGYPENWARSACSLALFACQNPQLTTYISAGLAGLWILLKFAEALRD
ncbi:MAG TPA: hypothetical protein VHX43_01240 [Xanthobacteraceae bacterium]|jgi:hypothetical protein|nr:hypothetical protein [Xanthobacteraceae bacterium]